MQRWQECCHNLSTTCVMGASAYNGFFKSEVFPFNENGLLRFFVLWRSNGFLEGGDVQSRVSFAKNK